MNFNIRTMDWDKLRYFYLVAQSPSFSKASSLLKVSQPQLSRRIAALEDNLGFRLFERKARGIALLKEGEELLRVVSKVFNEFARYDTSRVPENDQVQGSLKMVLSPTLPVLWLLRSTPHFLNRHPHINFSLSQQDNLKGDFAQQADCGIQTFDPSRVGELIQTPLLTLHYGLYASKAYLESKGTPQDLDDLPDHTKLVLRSDTGKALGWPLSLVSDPTTPLIHHFSTSSDLLWAVKQGIGIAAMPQEEANADPDLIRILPEIEGQALELYYVYPTYYQGVRRVTLYGEFLAQQFNLSNSV